MSREYYHPDQEREIQTLKDEIKALKRELYTLKNPVEPTDEPEAE